ncbi:MAG: hypothetical protein LBE13_08865 [Bacteroidales bacterium]|jgi:hypothetical protein|nr:hypothetical protein [Bacteroidales bacterium]
MPSLWYKNSKRGQVIFDDAYPEHSLFDKDFRFFFLHLIGKVNKSLWLISLLSMPQKGCLISEIKIVLFPKKNVLLQANKIREPD